MAAIQGRKKFKQRNLLYIAISVLLISIVFTSMIGFFYSDTESEAHEMLHIQTKQIKDDLTLQLKSDRENLVTMANFAANLYAHGKSYDSMFESFQPIGLFSNIGILTPENIFITKTGTIDLDGKISFEDEKNRGAYISGRVADLTIDNKEIIRSAVPIISGEDTVGILYGVIHLETIGNKYNQMAKELDAQLFVYDKESGKYIIDTINEKPGELSELKDRKFNDDYSYEALVNTDKGYTSFKSIFTDENLFVHYSTLEDFGWGIMLARYESHVFAKARSISRLLLVTFFEMVLIIVICLIFILKNEKARANVVIQSSGIRKLLLDINQQHENVIEALKKIQNFSHSRSVFYADTDGENYNYTLPDYYDQLLTGGERKFFISKLLDSARIIHNANGATISSNRIVPGSQLAKVSPDFNELLLASDIKEILLANVVDKKNHISLLGIINPKKEHISRALLEDIAVCFSIAIYNKKHLNKTEIAATTDPLTGALNRVSYKKDIIALDEEKPENFSCIYVDVNELHIRNNKYGHASGDEMLIYIADTLKEIFFGQKVYRMGGDEFLVFSKDTPQKQTKENIDSFIEKLKLKKYNVAIGMSFRSQNTNCEEMVREAEIRMYEAKAQYYQNKEQKSISRDDYNEYILVKTGISEIDTILSVLKEHYNGIYRVSLNNDSARRILMPSYLGYNEHEQHFSKLLSKYVSDLVDPDFHRSIMSFLNYDAIKNQIAKGNTPRVSYKKVNGETVILSIYPLDENKESVDNTLWVFSNG